MVSSIATVRKKQCASLALALAALTASTVLAQDADAVRALNKAVVTRYMKSLDAQDHSDAAKEALARDYRQTRAEFANLAINATDPKLAKLGQPLRAAIPDRSTDIVTVVGENNLVAVQYRIKGTHQANLYGIASTGKAIDIDAVAVFTLANGKITEGWYMADEAGLLRQLGTPLPARSDGKRLAATVGPSRPGDEVLAELLAHPVDSQEYRNKLKVVAYKSKHPPTGLLPASGSPYGKSFRRGFANLTEVGIELGQSDKMIPQAYPDRLDKIEHVIADGDRVFLQFQLTGNNTKSLFGMAPSNAPVAAYELGMMKFDGSTWSEAWFFGDDLGMLQQIGGPSGFWFGKKAAK